MTLRRESIRSIEMLDDLLCKSGCIWSAGQDRKTVVAKFRFFALKKYPKANARTGDSLLSTSLIDNSGKVSREVLKIVRYQPM